MKFSSKQLNKWIDSSRKFGNETQIDWKGRNLEKIDISSEYDSSVNKKYKIVNKNRFIWSQGAPELIKSKPMIHKNFSIYPHKYTKGERRFWYNSLPLTPNERTSFYLGKFPAKFGSRPNKFIYPDPITQAYFLKSGFVHSGHLNDPRNYVQVGGTWNTNRSTVQKFCDCDENIPEFNKEVYNSWRPILKRFVSKLKVCTLIPPDSNDIDNVQVSDETYAGVRWDVFHGLQTKGKAAKYAVEVAKRQFHFNSKRINKSNSLWSIGAREKREDEVLTEGEEVTSRGVHMPEIHDELLSFIWSKPVEKYFHSLNNGPLYLGQSFNKHGWLRLQRDLDFSKFVIEGDWKKYDSSLIEELIVISFGIIRSFYPDEPWIDRQLIYLLDHFVNRNYVTPGGFCFRICKGVPSGSAFTALVNSLVNFLLLSRTCFEKFKIRKSSDVRFAIGGDDFLIFLKEEIGDTNDLLGFDSYCNKRFGVTLKEFKVTKPFPKEISKCPSFYKTIIYKGLPTIRPDHLYEKLLSPFSSIRNNWRPEDYLNTLFACPPAPFKHITWLMHLVGAYNKVNKISFKSSDFLKMLYNRFERQLLGTDTEINDSNTPFKTNKKTIRSLFSKRDLKLRYDILEDMAPDHNKNKYDLGKLVLRKISKGH